jgi:hypothetical protein
MTETAQWIDGNDLAGPVQELFTADVTVARGRCAGCGQEGMLAETHVFYRAPGLVVRCSACDAVMMRLVRAPGRAWLDMRGISHLEFSLPD